MALDLRTKILVVEDFNSSRKMEIETLDELGFKNIIEAVNGDEAISQLKAHEDIGLIISDWNMPEKNGYELLQWVRSENKYKHIPFIMATAQAEKKESLKAADAGVNHFIIKPFDAEELGKVIKQVFEDENKGQNIFEDIKPPKISKTKVNLKIGHIQITDHLVLGVLSHLIETGELSPKYFELETKCMSGWNPVQNALENKEVDAAFILAPIAMDLFSFGVPIKLILFAHKNGSICVKNKKTTEKSFRKFFKDTIFYIPHVLSVHHMFSKMFFHEIGLNAGLMGRKKPDVIFEVIPPVKMPEFLGQSSDASGFMVAQPVGRKTIADGNAQLLFLSGEIWEYHPCCVVAMQETVINAHPDAVHEFTDMLVKSGRYIEEHPDIAAKIGVDFLDPKEELQLSIPVLEGVLKEPYGIKTDDLFPVIEDLDRIQRYMSEKMGIGTLIDLEKFVDTQFADDVCYKVQESRQHSVFHDLSDVVQKVIKRV